MMNHQIEVLNTALNGYLAAERGTDFRAMVRAESVLFDACLDAGMDHDEPVLTDWAAITVNADMGSL